MAETEVAVRFTSKEEAQLFQAFVKLTAGFTKVKDGAEKTKKSTDDLDASLKKFSQNEIRLNERGLDDGAARIAKLDAALKASLLTQEQYDAARARMAAKARQPLDEKIGAFAEQVKRLDSTPLDRLAEKQAMLNQAVEAGKLTQEQATAASRRFHAEHRAELEKSTEAERRGLERVEAEWDQYAASVKEAIRTPIQTYHAKLEKLSEAHLRGKLTLDEYHAAASKAFGRYRQDVDGAAKSQGSLSANAVMGGTLMANAYMKAGQVVTDVFRRAAEELDKLKEKSRDAGDQYGELAQLQANTPALVEQVNQLMASGAVKSFAEGKAAVFAAESAGAQGSMPALSELAKFGVIQQMPEVIRSAEALRFTLGEQAGTPEEILAKSFASARSATTTAERVTIAASKSGTSGRELGINADESLAAAGILASAKGNADTAGERLAALFRGLKTQDGMQGKTLPQMIQTVQGMNLSFADRQKFLGGSEADEAFSVLQAKLPQLAKTIAAVTDARGAETLRTIAKDAAAIPETALAANARAAQAKADLSGRQLGNVGMAVEAAFNEKVAGVRQQAQIEEAIRARRVAAGEDVAPVGTSVMRAEIEVAALRTFEQFAKMIPGMQQHLAETAEASKETTKLMRDAAKANLGAAAALERAATRRDNLAAPRREAAAAHGGG